MTACRTFEQGPIRPPSEASSLLVRVNRNCPWNRCTFCSIYKKQKFSTRPVEEVIADIDSVHRFITLLEAGESPAALLGRLAPGEDQAFFAARNFQHAGMESVFLQDADALTVRPENLVRILSHLKERFPRLGRITTYARSETVARIGAQALQAFARAGLNRIHIGMETASDTILRLVQKGVTKEGHVRAGQLVKEAGIELSEYVLTGIGGTEFSQEHAVECADALNRIDPDFIRFRTLHLPDKIELFAGGKGTRYRWAPDLVLAREILTLIEGLDGITSYVASDHSYNLFQEIEGRFPKDRERLAALLKGFIALSPEEQLLFQVGKRAGYLLRLSDLKDPERVRQVRQICRESGITPENGDRQIHEIVQERMRRGMPF